MTKARLQVLASCVLLAIAVPSGAFAWDTGGITGVGGDGCACGGGGSAASPLLLTVSFAVSCLVGFLLPATLLAIVALRMFGVQALGSSLFTKWYWEHCLAERYQDACDEVGSAVKAGKPLYAAVIAADYLGRFVLALISKLKGLLLEAVARAAGYGNPTRPGGR